MKLLGIFLCLLLAFLSFDVHAFDTEEDLDGDFDHLDNLGYRISARVQRQLAHLDGLGDRINAQVQRNLDQAFGRVGVQPGVENNGRTYQDDHKTYTLSNMGSRISQQVEEQMAPLHNLGDRINAQVQKSLEPVRALEMHVKMKNGVGGVTIAEHFPSGRIFFIRNHEMFSCNGNVDWNKAKCLGTEERFGIRKREDWCFAQPGNYVRANDQICLSTGTVSVSVINNVIQCHAQDHEGLVLLTSVSDFRTMCRGKSESVNYKYFADPGSPIGVKIPNENPYLKCRNRQENVCEFTENHEFS